MVHRWQLAFGETGFDAITLFPDLVNLIYHLTYNKRHGSRVSISGDLDFVVTESAPVSPYHTDKDTVFMVKPGTIQNGIEIRKYGTDIFGKHYLDAVATTTMRVGIRYQFTAVFSNQIAHIPNGITLVFLLATWLCRRGENEVNKAIRL